MKGDASLCMFTVLINKKKALECTEIQCELLLFVYSVGVHVEPYLQHFNKNLIQMKQHILAGD